MLGRHSPGPCLNLRTYLMSQKDKTLTIRIANIYISFSVIIRHILIAYTC